ncbi:MAG: hypothetical protein WD669_12710 [Pirellulales bacterium]
MSNPDSDRYDADEYSNKAQYEKADSNDLNSSKFYSPTGPTQLLKVFPPVPRNNGQHTNHSNHDAVRDGRNLTASENVKDNQQKFPKYRVDSN